MTDWVRDRWGETAELHNEGSPIRLWEKVRAGNESENPKNRDINLLLTLLACVNSSSNSYGPTQPATYRTKLIGVIAP